MKILIDARPLQTGSRFRGIGRYVNLLLEAFGNDKRFYFLFFKEKNMVLNHNIENIILIKSPRRGITFTDKLFLPKIFKRNEIDVYHSTAYALPRRLKNIKYVFTFYDITPLKFPEYSTRKNLYIFKKIFGSSRYADKVIAISERSKFDLMSNIGIKSNKVEVIYPALSDANNRDKGSNCSIKMKLPNDFVLYVGGFDGNKNVITILRALNLINLPLLLLGNISKNRKEDLMQYVAKEKIEEIFFLGYVSDKDLKYFYKKAKVMLFPSLYEGFGYPPLEALENGTPSIVSKCGSLPEIMEDAALYMDDPLNHKELAVKIDSLLRDDKAGDEIIRKGKKILEKYSLAKFTDRMEQLYSTFSNNE